MSKFEAFRTRMGVNGATHQEAMMNLTKRKAHNYIMGSPSRTNVEVYRLDDIGMGELALEHDETRYAIVSDKETFYKRTILFRPDEGVELGTYLKYGDRFYLATDISDVEGYPQAFADYCNHVLKLEGKESREIVGRDSAGRPIYKTTKPEYELPVHITSKIYSVLDNSPVPLPAGSVMIYLPYHDEMLMYVNYTFDFQGLKYIVTTVNPVNVLTNNEGRKYGYYEIRAQRTQGEGDR